MCAAAGCGRFDFAPHAGDAGVDDGAAADVARDTSTNLDTTICDELPTALFCESFEGAVQLTFPEATSPSFVVADGSRPYRGQRSLHSQTTRSSEPAWLVGNVLPTVMSGELHVRWYIYVPAEPLGVNMASVHVVEMADPNNGVRFGFTQNEMSLVCTEAGMSDFTPTVVPRDRWACVQLRVVVANAGGSLEAWVDGVPAGSIVGIDTLPASGYRNVHAGMFAGASTSVQDLWTDELVVATTAVPCD
jgi:hypothetical protein